MAKFRIGACKITFEYLGMKAKRLCGDQDGPMKGGGGLERRNIKKQSMKVLNGEY